MFKSTFTVAVENRVPSAVVKRCAERGISLSDVEITDGALHITVAETNRLKIIALFDELCYNYKIIETKGLKNFFAKFFGRAALTVTAALVFVMFALLPCFVLDIEIESGGLDRAAIENALSRAGVYEGMFAYNTDCERIENELRKLDGAAFVTVVREGTKLKASVYPELPRADLSDEKGANSVSSLYDAVITRQIVYSGTPVCKIGGVVKKGGVLIDGYVSVGDDRVGVTASGDVYGLVAYAKRIVYRERFFETEYTGNSKTEAQIGIFGRLSERVGSPYAMSEERREVFRNPFLLPYEVTLTTYRELEKKERYAPFAEVYESLAERAKNDCAEGLPPDAVVTDEQVNVIRLPDCYVVEAVVQVEQKINE